VCVCVCVCVGGGIVSVNVVASQQHEQHMSKGTAVQKFRKHLLKRWPWHEGAKLEIGCYPVPIETISEFWASHSQRAF